MARSGVDWRLADKGCCALSSFRCNQMLTSGGCTYNLDFQAIPLIDFKNNLKKHFLVFLKSLYPTPLAREDPTRQDNGETELQTQPHTPHKHVTVCVGLVWLELNHWKHLQTISTCRAKFRLAANLLLDSKLQGPKGRVCQCLRLCASSASSSLIALASFWTGVDIWSAAWIKDDWVVLQTVLLQLKSPFSC